MKQRALLFLLVLIILTACGPAPTAEPTPDLQATTQSISSTMVAETLTAQPTATQVPTNTPEPSATPTTAPTLTPLIEQTPSSTPTQVILATPTQFLGTFGDPQDDRKGLLLIENMTGEKEIIISMEGVSLIQNTPFYIAYKVNGNMKVMIPWAHYKYTIQIPNKKTFTGTFTQNNKDKTTMKIKMQQVDIIGP